MNKISTALSLIAGIGLLTTTAMAEDAMDIAKLSGCTACHAIDKKIVGPPWRDVAKRYRGKDIKDTLIKKVKTGGKGNWTDITHGISMPPYSPRVSDENIAKLVDFILKL